MFSIISNRFKTISENNIKPNKLIETIKKIEKEINYSMKKFNDINKIKNKIKEEIHIPKQKIDYKIKIKSEIDIIKKENQNSVNNQKYYDDLKKIFDKYSLSKTCKDNKDCKEINKEIEIFLQFVASEEYYNDLKKIFDKYLSCKACKGNKGNKDCKNNKYEYYKKLKELFCLNKLINKDFFTEIYPSEETAKKYGLIFININNNVNNYNLLSSYKVKYPTRDNYEIMTNIAYSPALKESERSNINYRFKIIDLITNCSKALTEKIKKYEPKNINQNGGKKIIKKNTIKKDIKNPKKKFVKK